MSLTPSPPCVLCCSQFGPTSTLCFVLQSVWPHLHPVYVLCCSQFGPTSTLCFVLQSVWPHLHPAFCVAVSLAPPPLCVLCCSQFGPTSTLSYRKTGLSPFTSYQFRLVVSNSHGSTSSLWVTNTTQQDSETSSLHCYTLACGCCGFYHFTVLASYPYSSQY